MNKEMHKLGQKFFPGLKMVTEKIAYSPNLRAAVSDAGRHKEYLKQNTNGLTNNPSGAISQYAAAKTATELQKMMKRDYSPKCVI